MRVDVLRCERSSSSAIPNAHMSTVTSITPSCPATKDTISVLHDASCWMLKQKLPARLVLWQHNHGHFEQLQSMLWYSHLFSRMMRRSTEPKHVRERRARGTEGCHPRFLSHCCRVPVPRQVHVGRGCRAKSLPGCVRDDSWWREDLYQTDLR